MYPSTETLSQNPYIVMLGAPTISATETKNPNRSSPAQMKKLREAEARVRLYETQLHNLAHEDKIICDDYKHKLNMKKRAVRTLEDIREKMRVHID